MTLSNYLATIKFLSLDYVSCGAADAGLARSFCKTSFDQKQWSPCLFFSCGQPCLANNSKRMAWSIRSSIDDSSFTPSTSNANNGRTRLIRVIQDFLTKLGDWDILSAALAVVVVEGIGALMYRASLPLASKGRSLISMFNYWKAGLTLGLFLDSFKY
ncbi:uncharacterized protein LOC129309285 isoform X2 [Prosopis cineraria]|uniref:uncharacterized protein LOC129309285 isoform X2 n=1 Tax=Prosopis cineraria TaxID=364024 RepID=UPI00240EBAD5|nr:uncharacterized protein LOC129309285 isoform X2 [Prosopis cineraria]